MLGGSLLCEKCIAKGPPGSRIPASEPDDDDMTMHVQTASAGLRMLGDTLVTMPASADSSKGEEERSLVVTLVTPDRTSGDALDAAGSLLEDFREHPVVLFHHRHDLPAVGKVAWVRVVGAGAVGGDPGRLVAKIIFARTRLGEELYSLYSRGYMKEWAVGFIPYNWTSTDGGVRVTQWKLLEVSAMTAPAATHYRDVYAAIQSGEVMDPILLRALGAGATDTASAVDSGGAHLDEGKLRLDLVPPEADEAMAGILTYGLAKYLARNWEKGIAWMRVYASVRRHLLAWVKGQDIDPESGLPHLDHALTDIAFLVTYARRGMDGDDRPAVMGRSDEEESS